MYGPRMSNPLILRYQCVSKKKKVIDMCQMENKFSGSKSNEFILRDFFVNAFNGMQAEVRFICCHLQFMGFKTVLLKIVLLSKTFWCAVKHFKDYLGNII